ncbi:signal peptidase I [Roseimaritima sediminicola]|uniref:signal peptidase I n=1 Tax=Roseimaritima sediminicola TaxID=2662066 RepID=UPI001298500E|nr:signal peptidase I [Roseimaritima sediminicola]
MAKNSPSGTRAANRKTDADSTSPVQRPAALAGYRETVESICVAIILALLFRSFVAEAFIIPTGSMAPTLMGAHKDLSCEECDYNFRVGASVENKGSSTRVVAGRCPNCRKRNVLRLADEANHATFNGDRILVSKFAYAIQDPQRWDVIVFKYPGNPKQNYIKRLVGLPNETLRIWHGDVYTRTSEDEPFRIMRKPDRKVMPLAHLVYNSSYLAEDLLAANYPSRLQPWDRGAEVPPEDSWQIQRDALGLTATVTAGDTPRWLRYFHNLPSDEQRRLIAEGVSMQSVDPYRSEAITDFYAYDSYVPQPLINNQHSPWESSGLHWVGDLTFETALQTSADASEAILEIVEAGIRYRCTIDLASGQATLAILGEQAEAFESGAETLTAATEIRAGQARQIRFSNVDSQLRLWVDDDVIAFEQPAYYDPSSFQAAHNDRPHYTKDHPLDAAPVGVAVRGGEAVLRDFRLYRDQYYIAAKSNQKMHDYPWGVEASAIMGLLDEPSQWDEAALWERRRAIAFELGEDQFFPMGDNSPESKDARSWGNDRLPPVPDEDAYKFARYHHVPRDLLVGKALLVFWPHHWNRPIPFTPNFKRMKLIR